MSRGTTLRALQALARFRREELRRLSDRVVRECRRFKVPANEVRRYVEYGQALLLSRRMA